MNYRLVVTTHGENRGLFAPTLDAFLDYASPAPSSVYVHCDGTASVPAVYDYARSRRVLDLAEAGDAFSWTLGGSHEPDGFCGSVRHAWNEEAADGAHDYAFWLEHDFLLERPVDLRELAAVLQANPTLAQMALMRDAVNEQEKAAGGLYESRPGQYVYRSTGISSPDFVGDRRGVCPAADATHTLASWLEHRAYLTTNPSLMRRAFLQHNPWPDYEAECEGRFSIDLVHRGYSFGVWGSGEPWCRHVGERTGHGY